jgi:hypothetical protein
MVWKSSSAFCCAWSKAAARLASSFSITSG